jgi:hypothetical protein
MFFLARKYGGGNRFQRNLSRAIIQWIDSVCEYHLQAKDGIC